MAPRPGRIRRSTPAEITGALAMARHLLADLEAARMVGPADIRGAYRDRESFGGRFFDDGRIGEGQAGRKISA